MPDHEASGRALLFGEREELRRKLAHHVAVEPNKVRDPEAVQYREQEQWIFGGLAERFSLRNSEACLIEGRFCLTRRKALGVHKGVGEGDLQLNLFVTKRRRGWQSRNLGQRTGQLRLGLHQRRARQRSLSRLAPQERRLLGQSGLGAVTRQKLGLALRDVGELAFD